MSDLPPGWVLTDLATVTTKIGSGATPKGGQEAYLDSGIPLIRSMNVHFDGVRLKGLAHLSEAQAAALSNVEVHPADVLLNITGASIGRVAVAPPELAGARVNQHVAILRPVAGVEPHFLRVHLASPDVQKVIGGENYGVTRPALTKGLIEQMTLPLPPLAEQRRIVAKLDSLTARTARARADLDRIPTLGVRQKQAALAAAFRGDLTASWRQENPPEVGAGDLKCLVLRQRQDMRREKGLRGSGANRSVPHATEDLPDLPPGWEWMTFDECSWDLTVGHVGPMKDRYVETGVPFLRSLNVKANRIDRRNLAFIDDGFHAALSKSQLHAGTIVIIRTGEPGVAAVIPADLGEANCSDLVICRPVPALNPEFGARYINSDFAKRIVRGHQVGVAQQHFNVGAMSQLPVPVAPPAEQAEIVRRLEAVFAEIDRLVAEAAAARRQLDRLDQAILTKAFRGELVPQDPADEPASVLLDRIRAERAAAPAKARRGSRAVATAGS